MTLKPGRGQHRKYLPYAFTEQGVAMLSSVINSGSAIAVNIQSMRACVQLRGLFGSNQELARRFAQLEARIDKKLSDHDAAIAAILSAIRELMNPRVDPKRTVADDRLRARHFLSRSFFPVTEPPVANDCFGRAINPLSPALPDPIFSGGRQSADRLVHFE